jgi:NADH-quinone oxidoreductase subunit C
MGQVLAAVSLEDLGADLVARMPNALTGFHVRNGELTLEAVRDQVIGLLRLLKASPECRFETLIDICGVDRPEAAERFEVVYHLLSMKQNLRVRVRVRAAEDTPVPSAVEVWPAANWLEREAFDMYGIRFSGHPDLRRILTDYGFEGFPLRKEFPLTGHVEVRYDALEKRVVYEPVKLVQEYRNFDFLSPWEGIARDLPGDEKAKS